MRSNAAVAEKTPLHILPPGLVSSQPRRSEKPKVKAQFIAIDKAPSEVAILGSSRDAKYSPFVLEVLEKIQKQDDPQQTVGVNPIVDGTKIEEPRELRKIAALVNAAFKKSHVAYRMRFSPHYDCFVCIPSSMATRRRSGGK